MVSLSRAVRSASLLIVVSSAASAFGQVTINEATLFWIADQGANGQYAEMRFSQPLTAAPTADQIHIMMKPSGRVLRLSNPRRGIGQPDLLVVNWTSDVLPSEDDTSFSVTIDTASFSGPSAVVQHMQKDGEFYTRGNVQKYYDARKKAFDDAIAVGQNIPRIGYLRRFERCRSDEWKCCGGCGHKPQPLAYAKSLCVNCPQ